MCVRIVAEDVVREQVMPLPQAQEDIKKGEVKNMKECVDVPDCRGHSQPMDFPIEYI